MERVEPNNTIIPDTRPYRVGQMVSPCGKYIVFRENYRIYVIVGDQRHDITPKAWQFGYNKSDVYISDWGFTPDSTILVYIDRYSKSMYFVLLADLSYIGYYHFASLASYDTMTIKTPNPNGVLIWEIAHLLHVDNHHVVVITEPSQFMVYNFKTMSARYYRSPRINTVVFPELDDAGSRFSFIDNNDRGLKYHMVL